jgi:hypothetical protein
MSTTTERCIDIRAVEIGQQRIDRGLREYRMVLAYERR